LIITLKFTFLFCCGGVGVLWEGVGTSFKLYLTYYNYITSYTTFNHARWHQCLHSVGLPVGGNPAWWGLGY